MNSNLIPILLVLPLIGAVLTLLTRKNPKAAGPVALICSLVPLVLVIYLVAAYPGIGAPAGDHPSPNPMAGSPAENNPWHFTYEYEWLPNLGFKVLLGVDSISLWMIVLTAVLTPISILASFNYIKERKPEFYAWMLVLHTGMLGVFAARDLLLFYLFFEFTLIPMFFIIGIWGGVERRKAAGKFFLFTFAGSVLTLASLIYIAYLNSQVSGHLSFAMDDLYHFAPRIAPGLQNILFLGLLAGFAVKVPLFPVHTWLPLAHTEAPTAGSVILAGVLLKLGTYGMLRFLLPVLPDATLHFAPMIATVCVVGIIYGALVSWAQGDMKKLIAYSSVSHLAFCVLGMFALTPEGLTGSVLYMINHGLSTGALFLVVGMIYERYHTRDMNQVGGIVRRVPALAFFAVFFVFSSVALPGLNGFVSEFLVLLGTFVSGRPSPGGPQPFANFGGNLGPAYAIPAATGVILGAVYLLYWAGRVLFGPLKEPAHEAAQGEQAAAGAAGGHEPVKDLSLREWVVLAPIAILVVVLGVYPKPVIDSIQQPVHSIADAVNSVNPIHAAAAPATPAVPAASAEPGATVILPQH